MSRCCSVQQPGEFPPVVAGRVGHRPGADEPVTAVDADMALVAVDRRGDLHHQRAVGLSLAPPPLQGPAPVAVLLAQLRRVRRPVLRDAARLQLCLLGVGVALPRRRHDRGVDHLPAHGEVAAVAQMRVEAGEQDVDRLGPGQQFAEQPDRAGVRNPPVQVEAEEAHEAEPVADLELGLLVRQPVERLQHQDLEHHHRIHRRPAALRPSERASAASRSARKISKSTTAASRSSGSPSSTAPRTARPDQTNPAAPPSTPPSERWSRLNHPRADLARYLEVSYW